MVALTEARERVGQGLAATLKGRANQAEEGLRIADLAARLGSRVEPDHGRVDMRRRQEAAAVDRTDPTDRADPRERDRRAAVGLRARRRTQAIGDLALDHDHPRAGQRVVVEQAEEQRAGQLVREVADDRWLGVAARDQRARRFAVVEANRVGLVQVKAWEAAELDPKDLAQIAIALDRVDLEPGREQVRGQGPEPRADLDHRLRLIAALSTGRDDLEVDLARVQEVLAPALAWRHAMATQQLAGRGDRVEIDHGRDSLGGRRRASSIAREASTSTGAGQPRA